MQSIKFAVREFDGGSESGQIGAAYRFARAAVFGVAAADGAASIS